MNSNNREFNESTVVVKVLSARHLPLTTVVGSLKTVRCAVTCFQQELQTRPCSQQGGRSIDEGEGCHVAWNQEFRFKVSKSNDVVIHFAINGSSSSSAEPGMHLTSLIGHAEVQLLLDQENPFSQNFSIVRESNYIGLNGPTTSKVSSAEWTSVTRNGNQLHTTTGLEAGLQLQFEIETTFRDTSYAPSRLFLEACSRLSEVRSPEDIIQIATEILSCMPSTIQLSEKLVILLAEAAELMTWNEGDIVELQSTHASESSIHFVLTGRIGLFSHENGPNMAVYKLLKAKASTYETSFGPLLGWRGAGEVFGEGALLTRGGTSTTAICQSESASSLRINGRICQEIMHQYRKSELVYSMDLQMRSVCKLRSDRRSILDVAKIASLLKSLDFRNATSLTDEMILDISSTCTLAEIEQAGSSIEVGSDFVAIVCCGTASVHLKGQNVRKFRKMCFPCSECIDIISAGRILGLAGQQELTYFAREKVALILIPKTAFCTKLSKLRIKNFHSRAHDNVNAVDAMGDEQGEWNLGSVIAVFEQLKACPSLQHVPERKLWHLAQTGKAMLVNDQSERPGASILFVQEGTLGINGPNESEFLQNNAELYKNHESYRGFVAQNMKLFQQGERSAGHVLGLHENFLCKTLASVVMWDLQVFMSALEDVSSDLHRGNASFENARRTALLNAPILKGIPKASVIALSNALNTLELKAGKVLIMSNTSCACLYMVVRGSVALCSFPNAGATRKPLFATDITCSDLVLQSSFGSIDAIVGEGQCFGQPEFLLKCKSCFTAVCLSDATLLMLKSDAHTFDPIIWANMQGYSQVFADHGSWEQIEIKILKLYKGLQDLPGSKIFGKLATRSGVVLCKRFILDKMTCREDDTQPEGISAFFKSPQFASIKALENLEKQRMVRLLLSRMPLFSTLKAADFHRLEKISKIVTYEREDEIFDPFSPADSVSFLMSGEAKVIQRGDFSVTCVLMGPGACFGKLMGLQQTQQIDSGLRWIVFANSECVVVQTSTKELQTTLTPQSLAVMKRDIESSIAIASRSPASVLFSKSTMFRPIRGRPVSADPLSESVKQLDARPATSQGFRSEQDNAHKSSRKIPGGSKAMRDYYEIIAKGKMRPSRSSAMIGTGPLPEEILPSFQSKFRKSFSRGQSLHRISPSENSLWEEELQGQRNASLVHMVSLKILDPRIQKLRNDVTMRETLKQSIKNQKRERLSQGSQNFRKMNVSEAVDPACKERKRDELIQKSSATLECIRVHREENDKRFDEKMAKTLSAINRKESNDQRIVDRMEEAQLRVSALKLIAEWMVLVELCHRTKVWADVLSKVRNVREDFLTWTAAAVYIQKAYHRFRTDRMGKRRNAARVIVKYARRFMLNMRIRKKRDSIHIVYTAIAQFRLLKLDISFYISRLYRVVIRLQRFVRSCLQTTRAQLADLIGLWNDFENKLVKQHFNQMRLKGRKPNTKALRTPQNVKVDAVRQWLKNNRKRVADERKHWRKSVVAWKENFKYRLLVHHQRELFSGETVAEVPQEEKEKGEQPRSIPMIEPPYPAFPSRPSDDEMSKLVKAAYERAMDGDAAGKRNSTFRRSSVASMSSIASKKR